MFQCTFVHAHHDSDSITDACEAMRAELGASPDWVWVTSRAGQPHESIAAAISEALPGVHIHGMTSSQGWFSANGLHRSEQEIGIWGISDPDGSFGSCYVVPEEGDDITDNTRQALMTALELADRPGEFPSLIFMTAPPGDEEAILQTIKGILGDQVVVIGGSSADDDLSGEWRLFNQEKCHHDGVLLSVFFPSAQVVNVFEGGYLPSSHRGRVTRHQGRVLHEIDGEPAAAVYDRWTKGLVSDVRANGGGDVLALATQCPLGKLPDDETSGALPLLTHPASIDEDGAIHLFTRIHDGEVLTLMHGGQDALVSRAARLVQATRALGQEEGKLRGLIVIFCAGCAMYLEDRMSEVVEQLREESRDVPLMGAMTFGEQGFMPGRGVVHGNLMISVVAFYDR